MYFKTIVVKMKLFTEHMGAEPQNSFKGWPEVPCMAN